MNDFIKGWLASEEAGRDIVTVRRAYVRMCNGNLYDSLILSQIMYWHGNSAETGQPRLRIERDGHLWLAKRYEDWQDECEINEHTARKGINRLKDTGLIETAVWDFSGKPTVHIRINWDAFEQQIRGVMRSDANDLTGQMQTTCKVISYTETTTENTNSKIPTAKKTAVGASSEKSKKTRSAVTNNTSSPADPPESIALVENITMRKEQIIGLITGPHRSHLNYTSWTGTDYGDAILHLLNKLKDDPSPGAPAYQNEVRYCLELAFRLRCPHLKVPANPKQAGVRWWQPFRELAEAVDWNAHTGVDLLNEAFVRAKGITVTAPQSLSSAVQSILVERAAKDEYVFVDDLERELEKRYSRNHEYKQYMNLGDKP